MTTAETSCPGCRSQGAFAAPCSTPGCAKLGLRFIPGNHADKAATAAGGGPDLLIGQVIGEHLIVQSLGRVSFGTVYMALDLKSGQKVALKAIARAFGGAQHERERLNRFAREASALARFKHPNIVRLLEVGLHRGRPVMVMEYVTGEQTLQKEMISRSVNNDPFHPAVILHIVHQLLDALAAAHDQRVIHRGLSPAKVLILPQPDGLHYRALLSDFGFVPFVEECANVHLAMDSPAYMAPEQLARTQIGPWTDLYAMGTLMFELLAGRLPFMSPDHLTVFARKLDPGAELDLLDLPPDLRSFLDHALAPEPEDRFQQVSEFRDQLDAIFAPLIESAGPLGGGAASEPAAGGGAAAPGGLNG